MDDAIGNGLADGGFYIAELIESGVKLRGKARRRCSRKALVGAVARNSSFM